MTEIKSSAPSTKEIALYRRLPRWLFVLGVGIPLALIVLEASPLGPNFLYVVFGIPALLFVWAIAGLGSLIVSLRSAMRREWRRCIIASVLPIVMLAVALDPVRFVRACIYLGDVAHFVVAKPYYDYEVTTLPADQRPRLLVFDWGGMVGASNGLVYDETDQVLLPSGRQSADWLAQASGTELSCKGYGVRPLWDHYYLASFPC